MKTDAINSLMSNKVTYQRLTADGQPTIHLCSSEEPLHSSIFLQDNLLVFVFEGRFRVRYGSLDYQIDKSKMIYLKKDRLFEIRAEKNQIGGTSNYECLLISLNSDVVKEFIKLAELDSSIADYSESVITGSIDSYLHECASSIKSFLNINKSVNDKLLKIKMLELLFYVAACNKGILQQILDLRDQYRTNITSVVEENITNSLTLNQLADLSGRSLSSFRRDFLAIYNMSPSKWIRQKRLEKAREMLYSTTMSITDICYSLGFENIAHFSRLFKSHFQYSPSAYRLNSVLHVMTENEMI